MDHVTIAYQNRKAINVSEDDIILVGDYFSTTVEPASTAHEVFLGDRHIPDCLVRRGKLGKIVTAFVQNGVQLNRLIEEPAGISLNCLELSLSSLQLSDSCARGNVGRNCLMY